MIVNIPAYAYEAQAGDVIDGRTVKSVSSTSTTTTITFTSGTPLSVPRASEVLLRREWTEPVQPVAPKW